MTPLLWAVEYEYAGRCWSTVVEAEDREMALRIFRRDNPGLPVRECWTEEEA